MPRPSQNADQALLQSGRELFPQYGCKGLSLRAVAEHAGVNVGMFHYHFKTKDVFLTTLLQGMYEEMFASFSLSIGNAESTIAKLRAALTTLALFARSNRRVLARVWMDAIQGEKVASDFFAKNAPRHFSVLFRLLQQAESEGEILELPPLQRFTLLVGSIVLPIILVSGLLESSAEPVIPWSAYEQQVLSDAAIASRIDLVLGALHGKAAPLSRIEEQTSLIKSESSVR